MGVTIIEYKNKKILYVDYRGVKTEEESDAVGKEGFRMQTEAVQAGNKMYDVLIHQGENPFTKFGAEALKQAFEKAPHKIAVVGLSGLVETVSKGVNTFVGLKNVALFNNEEEAKEWLVS